MRQICRPRSRAAAGAQENQSGSRALAMADARHRPDTRERRGADEELPSTDVSHWLNLKDGRETESHSLRQFTSNQKRANLIHVSRPRVGPSAIGDFVHLLARNQSAAVTWALAHQILRGRASRPLAAASGMKESDVGHFRIAAFLWRAVALERMNACAFCLPTIAKPSKSPPSGLTPGNSPS